MSLVHLVARDPESSCRMLGLVDMSVGKLRQTRHVQGHAPTPNQAQDESESALSCLLREWRGFHTACADSAGKNGLYNESVSTVGLLQLARMMSCYDGNNQMLAGQLFRTAVHSFPRLLCEMEEVTSEISNDTIGAQNGDEDDLRSGEDYGGDTDDYGDDPDEEANSTDTRRTGARYTRRAGNDPFAPAEKYLLSDMLNDATNRTSSGMILSVSVPEDLVFHPKRADPMLQNGLQSQIVTLVSSILSPSGDLPDWLIQVLTPQETQLIITLLQE
eukprot:CAMPEP_0182433246 /NCGR_PEP_ID=MMETSP1167-20130531/61956_1 /TAXON_ID=2988 /ORGANISM="Mallomonas Sp, Strain CCMP3275" /LENGTH=273 /DNA_ID=CAMNT_0024621711 /DNA_START=308 /DNA_END=1129 /DNA_ORIENTATION=+